MNMNGPTPEVRDNIPYLAPRHDKSATDVSGIHTGDMRSRQGLNYEVGRTYPWPEITRQDPFSPVSLKKAESISSRTKETKDNQHEHKGRNQDHKHRKYSSVPNSSSSRTFQYS